MDAACLWQPASVCILRSLHPCCSRSGTQIPAQRVQAPCPLYVLIRCPARCLFSRLSALRCRPAPFKALATTSAPLGLQPRHRASGTSGPGKVTACRQGRALHLHSRLGLASLDNACQPCIPELGIRRPDRRRGLGHTRLFALPWPYTCTHVLP